MADAAHDIQMRQIVAGLSEGVILIEPDQTIAYANAAAVMMHGVADVGDLGATVSEYRANFTLHYRNHREIGPLQHPLDRVLAGEEFRDVVVELAPTRDPTHRWMHRIRSLVTTDADGTPSGLALVMQDVSERYQAEARFERMFNANPAPAIICRIADLRFVRVNHGFLDLTGYHRDDVLGRSFCEIDLLRDAERRELAIRHLHAGHTIPQMEAQLATPCGRGRYVIVAGHAIEMPGPGGVERCMLFTFADLEDRRKAEKALRHSEERFAKAFELSPVPSALMSADSLEITSVNQAFVTSFGHAPETVASRSLADLSLWVDLTEQRRFSRDLKRLGSIRAFEAGLQDRNGAEIDCLVSAERVSINGETCVLCVLQDITARKRSERELITAIEAVMADASWFSHGVIDKLAALRHPPRSGHPAGRVENLTIRERDMLTRICQGATDQEIGAELKLSPNTVRNHVAGLYRKLGVNRRSAVVVWAQERGIGQNPTGRR
ncbi:PAS domain S-box protein [Methylobacterium sp. E-046]|uniref:PAS domain S-box protein n=1 Tax=Methylobacterium sp. E-046 TaxID=2836576 RepID=UPI001FBB4C8F|nr:PAS domain S-box protein [Methylobacterium sp. E-046]MCJ2097337.1 PAS domain S-box protein [Methylobacterium sp. E-046]